MNSKIQMLVQQHDDLRALATSYEAELSREQPDLQALAKCRWTLARLVSAHLACERMHLGALEERPEPGVRQIGQKLKKLAGELDAHVRNWTPDAIVRDWAEYGRASKSLMAMLCAHMAEEEQRLYPLLVEVKAA